MRQCFDLRLEPRFLGEYVQARNNNAEVLLTKPVTEEETRVWLGSVDADVLVLADDETFLGAAILYAEKDGEIAFFSARRGLGIGTALIKLAENAARKRQMREVWAWVLCDNWPARHCFERRGFRESDGHVRDYESAHLEGVVFRKRLTATEGA